MSDAQLDALAGWAVRILAACPECGLVHEVEILASEVRELRVRVAGANARRVPAPGLGALLAEAG